MIHQSRSASPHKKGHFFINVKKKSLLEKQLDTQLMKKFSQFRGKRDLTFMFTIDCHCSLFWAKCIQSTPFYRIPYNFNCKILPGPPYGPLPLDFFHHTSYAFFLFRACHFFLDLARSANHKIPLHSILPYLLLETDTFQHPVFENPQSAVFRQ